MKKRRRIVYYDTPSLNLKRLHQVLILWYILNLQAFLYLV